MTHVPTGRIAFRVGLRPVHRVRLGTGPGVRLGTGPGVPVGLRPRAAFRAGPAPPVGLGTRPHSPVVSIRLPSGSPAAYRDNCATIRRLARGAKADEGP